MAEDTPRRLRLGRASRIKDSRDFRRLMKEGQRLACGCLVANWRRVETGGAPRLGVVTSRKIGGAVARNRARRLLREAFRRHQHGFGPVDLVLVARPSIAGKSFAEVENDFLTMVRRTGL
jgi:ribonuclease P protein component